MTDCDYFAYYETFQAVRAALLDGDVDEAARLEKVVEQHRQATIRQLCSVAVRDARDGLPMRWPPWRVFIDNSATAGFRGCVRHSS